MKVKYIAHDNQPKSMKTYWPGKLSSFNWKRKMDETNWSSDFYSYIFSLGFDSLLNTKKRIFSKGHHAVGLPHSTFMFLLWKFLLH